MRFPSSLEVFSMLSRDFHVPLGHGRSDEPGYGANWKKIARFEKLGKTELFFKMA
jgi:hypothetical protein